MKEELIHLAPMLRRFAYSLTGSAPDADDLLQNTLERLLSRDIPADVELAKWAFRVCRNIWIDEYRARKIRQRKVKVQDTKKLRWRKTTNACNLRCTDTRVLVRRNMH